MCFYYLQIQRFYINKKKVLATLGQLRLHSYMIKAREEINDGEAMGRDAFLTEIVGMVIIAVGGSLFQRWHSRTLDVKTSSA